MESLVILLYILTAFVWCGIDIAQKDDVSFKNFVMFIVKFITFPFWVLKEKLDG